MLQHTPSRTTSRLMTACVTAAAVLALAPVELVAIPRAGAAGAAGPARRASAAARPAAPPPHSHRFRPSRTPPAHPHRLPGPAPRERRRCRQRHPGSRATGTAGTRTACAGCPRRRPGAPPLRRRRPRRLRRPGQTKSCFA